MDRIHNLEDFKIMLNSEYNRISSIPDRESITDSTASAKIAYLENKLGEMEDQMESGKMNQVFRTDRKEDQLERVLNSLRNQVRDQTCRGSSISLIYQMIKASAALMC